MNIRPFNPTDAEYEAAVALVNTLYPDTQPRSARDWRHFDESRNPKRFFQRLVAVDDGGSLLALGEIAEPRSEAVPGKYYVDMDILPAAVGIAQQLFDRLFEQIADREPKPTALLGSAREDQRQLVDFWLGQGFARVMRFPTSEIDLTTFDAAPYAGLIEKLAAQGICLYTLADVMPRDPQWKQKLYELDWEIEQDVPQPDPPTQEPMEEFEKYFERPSFRADSFFIAVDEASDEPGGTYAGISVISVRSEKPERVDVGVTGVARAYRRRGIATALKLKTFEFAESIGARYIGTDNEENNPMYELNMQLGFKPKPAWLDFEKALDNAKSKANVAELAIGD